ncbi:MAG: response regulator [Chitinivibrionales bacterium]|nr:response regulator [Chitinivibrionales bacterium]MBD3357489.1 response regulator [Chitinivibrionales bacterium]
MLRIFGRSRTIQISIAYVTLADRHLFIMTRNEQDYTFRLLVVDDEPNMINSLKRMFFADNYDIYAAFDGRQALEVLASVEIHAAIIDVNMPGMGGITLLEKISEHYPNVEAIMLTGRGGVEMAVKAMKLGASDFFEKPLTDGLRKKIHNIHDLRHLKIENARLRRQASRRFDYPDLLGNSVHFLRLKDTIAHIAMLDTPILILGETGTGKERVARAVHHMSPRATKPFVVVDCAGISKTVIESELYGHAKGAFTGAMQESCGLIRTADTGTLFIDEIGELPLDVQGKLLRTLQENEVRPMGCSESIAVNVRFIAATHRDLEAEVEAGRFRQDLFYRLNVISINVPPLRERKSDIPLLFGHFLEKHKNPHSAVTSISEDALHLLAAHDWPGNVRELENAARRLIALGGKERIAPDDISRHLLTAHKTADVVSSEDVPNAKPTGLTLADYERAAISNALHLCGGNRKKASTMLQIGEATLYRKIKQYGLGNEPWR